LLGLHQFGPIVNVDRAAPPYGNTRRLITAADVKNDAGRAHGSVVPGGAAPKDASGKFMHEDVWRYLFTHPVDQIGQPVPSDPACRKDLRPKPAKPQRTLDQCAQMLQRDWTPSTAVAMLGKPDRVLGSGLIIYEYDLAGGEKPRLGFPGMAPILYAKHLQANGATRDIPRK
jgi:hypothetical protein